MKYNQNIAMELYGQFNINMLRYTKMYNYYMGKTDIFDTYPKTDRSNKIVNTNYIKKFINEHVAYGVGNKIAYAHINDDTECIRDIERNIAIQKGSLDIELMRNMLIFGRAYEIGYINNDMLKFRVCNPLNSIAYCNTEGDVEMFLYFYKRELDSNIYIDCYTDEGIYHLNESFIEISEFTPYYFGCVPVSVAKLDDDCTLFDDIKTLQDAFENILSDWINNSADLRDAYLLLTGVELEEEDAKKMKANGVMQIPNPDGKAEFLIKNIPSDYIKNLAETLEDKIYQISQSVNSNEAIQSNLSGVALMSRIINLRNKIGIEQKALSDAIRNRLKILFAYLKLADNKDYNYLDIDIVMTMNVPSDDVSMAQIISQLANILPYETGLNQLSFIQNGKAQFEKKLEEQKIIQKQELNVMGGLDEQDTY